MSTFAETGFTVSPQANTASPAALMFCAALISRSCVVLHSGHVHWRVAKSNLSSVYPQQEHRLLDGNQRSIATTVRPRQFALYSSCLTSSPQLASLIDFANMGFFTIFLTAKFSTQITWFSLISVVVNLWVKSLRQSAICSWIRATFALALRRLLEPFCFFANRFWYLANLAAYFAVYRGFPDTTPSELITTSLIPTSIPTTELTTGRRSIFSSTKIDTKYRPDGTRDTVTVVGRPSNRLDHRISSGSDCLASLSDSPSHLNADVVYSADWCPSFFLKLGYFARPWKKFLYPVWRWRNTCCNGTLDTSLSQICSGSFFHSVNNAEFCR